MNQFFDKLKYGHIGLFTLIIVCLVPVLLYMCNFGEEEISKYSQDWSNFGSYIGGVWVIVSIVLIYITYREQCRTNHISQIEQRTNRQLENIRRLSEKYSKNLFDSYNRIEKHFHDNPGDDLCDADITMALKYYYLSIKRDYCDNSFFELLFDYIYDAICMIDNDRILNDTEKHGYLLEFFMMLNRCDLFLLLCYIIANNKNDFFQLLIKYDIYNNFTIGNNVMNKIMVSILSNSIIPLPTIMNNDLEFESYIDEQICNTIERLKR